MDPPIACMICAVDPATTSLLLPLAQVTLISAPILLRGRISRGILSGRACVGSTLRPAVASVAQTTPKQLLGASASLTVTGFPPAGEVGPLRPFLLPDSA